MVYKSLQNIVNGVGIVKDVVNCLQILRDIVNGLGIAMTIRDDYKNIVRRRVSVVEDVVNRVGIPHSS